ncbi:phage tail tube protein [Streptomyces sp. 8L]|uniref:phage tail tube protein n=1 Tax=Streptomyces sp. 8L TaxID=2877242 RepID=UPI001CD3800F|nr:hypothetical protein [Streptomyces sp. 8L]MCA1218701.1 hypothetical protein [Streptomyces sp. 8L]
MSRYGTSGKLGIYFLPVCADMSAPTVEEITAGVSLHNYVTRDGLKTPNSGNTVDSSVVGSDFTTTVGGTRGGDAATLTCQRDSLGSADLAWATLTDGSVGFIAVARPGWNQSVTTGIGSPEATPKAGDRCEVYSVEVLTRAMADIAENQTSRFDAQLPITAPPALDAVVAAAPSGS